MNKTKWHGRYGMPAIVFLLGLVSIALLLWSHQITKRQKGSFALTGALMDIQISASFFHLRLEEAIAGDPDVDMEKTWKEFSKTLALTRAVLEGGPGEHGVVPEPLREGRSRLEVETLKSLLEEFGLVAAQRIADPGSAGAGTPLYQRFDGLFEEVLARTKALELFLEEGQARDEIRSRNLFLGALLIWAGIVIASTMGIWNREARRERAEADLQRAKGELERRVEERTGELSAANISLQDEIAVRRLVEEELRKSEERYRVLVETMNDGLIVVDVEGVLTYVNERFCGMLGYSFGELIGRPCVDFVEDADREIFREELEKRRKGESASYELTFARKDGRRVIADVSPKAIFDGDGNFSGSFAVLTDVTEKIAFQAEAMRAAHLASIGELAAGVAHEINNPINGIINYAQILFDEGDEAGGRDIAGRILKEGNRIANIVRSLLSFARESAEEKAPVRVSDILSDSLGLMESQIGKEGIRLLIDVPPDLPEIVANSQQIQQVFLNVISNARHALQQKYPGAHEDKTLEISAVKVVVDGRDFVRIVFFDRGTGMPARVRDRVLMPFFTTKPRGMGTGLGLSISHGIVGDHDGKLSIESVEGEFTRVVIDLPAAEDK